MFLHLEHLAHATRKAADGSVPAAWLLPQLDKFSLRLKRFMAALDRLLDVSHMRAGRLDLQRKEVDFSEVVQEIAARFERELLAARSSLSIDPPHKVIGSWDRLRLEQIVSNLVSGHA